MSLVKSEDSKKWINSFVACVSIVMGYIGIKFVNQMGEWFDLEAKVSSFDYVVQGVGILVGLVTFIFIQKHKTTSSLLSEVYAELVKVVWPNYEKVIRVTIGIVIGLTILSGIFVGVDYVFRQILELIY